MDAYDVSQRIRYLRLNRPSGKMSLDEFGKSIGMTKSAAYNLENPERLPNGIPESTLKLICATYHVNYQWLTEGKEPMYICADPDSLIDNYAPDENEYFKAVARGMLLLSDDAWAKLRDFVQDMREKLKDIES